MEDLLRKVRGVGYIDLMVVMVVGELLWVIMVMVEVALLVVKVDIGVTQVGVVDLDIVMANQSIPQ